MMDDLTEDDFLGGRLKMLQPAKGYRAGIDPVLLAACIPARTGDSVLELGCGVGTALLCLGARVPGLDLTGLEVQASYAALAERNAAANAQPIEIITGDLSDMPTALRQRQFTHVLANPPYFDRRHGTPAERADRETALGEDVVLDDWVKAAAKRTAPKGTVSFIQRAERLPELLHSAAKYLGSLEVLPIAPRRNRTVRLVILRARKGGRAAFQCHDSWVLHAGDAHHRDEDDYTPATQGVLRQGAAIPFGKI